MNGAFGRTLAVLAGVCLLAATARAAAERDWGFEVTPYLWVAGVELETSLPDAPSSNSPERFDTRISGGVMLAAEAHYRSVGLFADFAWLRLDTEAVLPGPAYSAVDLRSDFIHSTAALSYRLPLEGKLQVEALAGARFWDVANDLESAPGVLSGFNASVHKAWVDPMVGASASYELSQRWSLGVKGLVGGFCVSANIAGEVFAGATYRFSDWCSATLGYRYLHEEYDRGFKFNLDAHGFLLGVGFRF